MNKADKTIITILLRIAQILTKYTKNIAPWDFQEIKKAIEEIEGNNE